MESNRRLVIYVVWTYLASLSSSAVVASTSGLHLELVFPSLCLWSPSSAYSYSKLASVFSSAFAPV